MKNFKKIATTFFKIAITLVLLYFVFRKVPFSEVWQQILTSRWIYLWLGLLAFIISQELSAKRLLRFFEANGFVFSEKLNRQLYLVGMFYNFFIPGGIGGDAYKVYWLQKNFGWGIKKLSGTVLADRLSGLLAILIWLAVLFCFYVKVLFIVLMLAGVFAGILISHRLFFLFFPDFKRVFYPAFLLSIGVQGLQILSVFFILKSFSITENFGVYFIVFLVSAILSVLSFSGIGVREWFFMKASQFFDFNLQISVSAALLFSFFTALVSLFGIFYQMKGLRKETEIDK